MHYIRRTSDSLATERPSFGFPVPPGTAQELGGSIAGSSPPQGGDSTCQPAGTLNFSVPIAALGASLGKADARVLRGSGEATPNMC
jgi:hypothetical protein